MPTCPAPRRAAARPRRSSRIIGLACALALAVLWAANATTAQASSEGNVTTDPSSGPIGTPVTVEIHEYPDTAQPYLLTVTATDPAQGGCASAQPISGVGPVTVGPQGGYTQFIWPDTLDAGPYWLCASPQSGAGPSAHSLQPFTVTIGPAPTPTVRGFDGNSSTATAVVNAPSDGAPAGSTVSVTILNWITADNAPPTSVKLGDQAGQTMDVPFTSALSGSRQSGSYVLDVTLPAAAAPGTYVFDIGDAYHVRTSSFDIVAAGQAYGTPIGVQAHEVAGGGAGVPPAVIGVVVGVLLLLAVAVLGATVVGRRRAERARRQREEERRRQGGYGQADARRTREEAWRR